MATPGSQTSEFTLAKVVVLAGTVIASLSTVVALLPGIGVSQKWVAVVLAGLAMTSKLMSSLGYQDMRTKLKQAELDAAAARGQAAAVAVQTVSEAVDEIKQLAK